MAAQHHHLLGTKHSNMIAFPTKDLNTDKLQKSTTSGITTSYFRGRGQNKTFWMFDVEKTGLK